MNSIQELTKCDWCAKQLRGYPLLLTCCHVTVCSHHVSDQTRKHENKNTTNKSNSKKIFWCKLCATRHDMTSKKFPQNKVVNSLLKLIVNEIQLNKCYMQAAQECLNLKSTIDECNMFVLKPEFYIVEQVGEMRNQVFMRRDELKSIIDKQCETIIKSLDDFERDCFSNLKVNLKLNKIEAITKLCQEIESKLDEWQTCLNRLVVDEQAWDFIQQKAFFADDQLQNHLNDLKDDLLENKFWNFKFGETFENEFHLMKR
jgi:hypothetical protein